MLPALYLQGKYPYDIERELQSVWVVDTLPELHKVVAALGTAKKNGMPVAVDTETDNCNPTKESPLGKAVCVTIQLAWMTCTDDEALNIALTGGDLFLRNVRKVWINCKNNPTFTDVLRPWLENAAAPKIFHNVAYDEHVLMNHGIRLRGLLADTLQMSREQYQERPTHGLDGELGLVRTLLGEKRLTTHQALGVFKKLKNGTDGKSVTFLSMGEYVEDPEMRGFQIVYSVFDVADTIRIFYVLRDKLRNMEWQGHPEGLYGYVTTKSVQLLNNLRDMERRGSPIDPEMAEMLVKHNYEQLTELSEEIYSLVGYPFSIGSSQQKAWLLYGEGEREFSREEGESVFDSESDQSIVEFLATRRRKKGKKEAFVITGLGLPYMEEAQGKDAWTKSVDYKGKTSSGYPSTDREALDWTLEQLSDVHPEDEEAAAHGAELIGLIQSRQKLATLISGTLMSMQLLAKDSYASGIKSQADGVTRYLHGSFAPKARTGRLTSNMPNLQNVPVHGPDGKLIRHAFCAPPGQAVVVCDFSQLELNVLSWYLAELFGDLSYATLLRNGDIHADTARSIDEDRLVAKKVNFGLIYGMSKYKLAADLRIPVSRADGIWVKYFQTYPQIEAYLDWAVSYGMEYGYCRTLGGRYRPLPFITETRRNGKSSSRAETDKRRAKNTPIQGSAADIVSEAMDCVNHDPVLAKLGYTLRLQVHDELVGTCPSENREEVLARKTYLMENAVTFPEYEGLVRFPVEGHHGATWADAKDGKVFQCPVCAGTGKSSIIKLNGKSEDCSACKGKSDISLTVMNKLFEEGMRQYVV